MCLFHKGIVNRKLTHLFFASSSIEKQLIFHHCHLCLYPTPPRFPMPPTFPKLPKSPTPPNVPKQPMSPTQPNSHWRQVESLALPKHWKVPKFRYPK